MVPHIYKFEGPDDILKVHCDGGVFNKISSEKIKTSLENTQRKRMMMTSAEAVVAKQAFL